MSIQNLWRELGALDVKGLATLRQKQKKYSESFKAAEAKRNDRVVYLNSFVGWLIYLDSILNAA